MEVGDRVTIVKRFPEELVGALGTIIQEYTDSESFDWIIRLDKFNKFGHDCGKDIENGFGRLIKENDVRLLIEESIGMSISSMNIHRTASMKELMDKVLDLEQQLELAKKELKERL